MKTFGAAVISALLVTGNALAGAIGGLGVQGGADWSYGSMGDGSSIQNRSMDTLSFRVFPNYDIATALTSLPVPLRLGPILSFGISGQPSDPASYSGQNLRGSGYRAGIAIGTDVGRFGIQAGFNFLGKHSLSNKTITGADVSYSGYVGGVLMASYQVLPYLAPSVVAEYGGYGKQSVGGGTASDLTNKLSGWSVGAGITLRYPFASEEPKKEGERK